MAKAKKKQGDRVSSRALNRAVRRGLVLYYEFKREARRASNSIEDAGMAPALVKLYLHNLTTDEAVGAVNNSRISRSAIGRFFRDLRLAGVSKALIYE